MGMHKYISRIRTKSGKWRYIYKDAGKGNSSDGHGNRTENLNSQDGSKKGIKRRTKKRLGHKFKRQEATQLPRSAMDTFKRPKIRRLWRGRKNKSDDKR